MADATFWWIFAGVAVAAELVTGTFYLLMLALGLAAGALAAHAGAGMTVQIVVAALVGGGAVAIWYAVRSRQPKGAPSSANRDINLDIGGTLQVDTWSAERTSAVRYRGAEWTAELAPQASAAPGAHRIVEVVGSRLIVEPLK